MKFHSKVTSITALKNFTDIFNPIFDQPNPEQFHIVGAEMDDAAIAKHTCEQFL